MKQCRKCKEVKPLTDFHKNKSRKDGCNSQCKQCVRNYQTENKSRFKQHYQDNKPRFALRARRNHLRREYGISLDDYQNLLKNQNGVCKICKRHENKNLQGGLSVDHCHKTGKVRGLLCRECNAGLGKFKDDIEIMQTAIEYLKQNNSVNNFSQN